MKKLLLFLLLLPTLAAAQSTQKSTITGIVTDADTKEPLIGTTVLVEGTTIGAYSDPTGRFTISNITPGAVSIIATYLGYEIFRSDLTLKAGEQATIPIALKAEGVSIENVVITARINRESENVILGQQRQAISMVQNVGAREMSRKGISDARGAVAQLAGVSQTEGVKNVFVRGLGDRYNATALNGFNLPSEDPEYKNIALELFGSDIIRNIGVKKVFTPSMNGDVGGAAIDIRSKELVAEQEFSIGLGAGINSSVPGAKILRSQNKGNRKPTPGQFDFVNRLDPSTVKLPMNHSIDASGGRRWDFNGNSLSLFAVGSHVSDYSFTDQTVRDATANGVVYKDQKGERSTLESRQLGLVSARLRIAEKHEVEYNFLLIHADNQYVGDYRGTNPIYADAADGETGFTRRQQKNDNLLITNQLSAKFQLTDRLDARVGAAFNAVRGQEPDRRENSLSRQTDNTYTLTGSNSQRRFYSDLRNREWNLRGALRYQTGQRNSVTLGYRGRIATDRFSARDYSLRPENMSVSVKDIDALSFDAIFNKEAFDRGEFSVPDLGENSYRVTKNIHSLYAEAQFDFTPRLSLVGGVQVDAVDIEVDYNVSHIAPGKATISKTYPLPSLSLRFDPAARHSLRFALSQSYTLPQSKEIAPYKYVNIGFSSEGNPNLKPSDNYNADLKWDWYPSSSEIISLGAFYKHIDRPIGRVDQGNSAGLLMYQNISKKAQVAGLEIELRKNLLNTRTARRTMNRLSIGANASYIHSDLLFQVEGTAARHTQLEGASPWLVGGDLSYNYSQGDRVLNLSIVGQWFSDRIHTLGTRTYHDIIERSVATLNFVASMQIDKHWSVSLKAGNLLNSPVRLSRQFDGIGRMTLEEYRRGVDVSLGITFNL